MPETQIIIDGKKLSYEGLFDAKDLYTVIDQLMAQHTFDKDEFLNSEHVYQDSKQLEMELRPYKKFSDYVKGEIKIMITATDLKKVEIEKKGVKRKLYNGKVTVTFYSYLITDYEGSWEMKPFYYLVRMLIDKFIYKGYITEAKNQLITVTDEVYDEIRSYLNMHRYMK
ncbi:MAG: hypothetical protein KJ583_05975 [Nanoarchaeota archaeon]|nr:hypothetical protein [Nanoarchaeota archaeon]MBU1270249.1 hypothetical protein [Nanoarchaeota archaeon]MBU1604833.1 hypothetical protein [Nanoarchaeota archaeon]MBU2442497.1 hypothetical protein [Nanoarchaeota archaeon]